MNEDIQNGTPIGECAVTEKKRFQLRFSMSMVYKWLAVILGATVLWSLLSLLWINPFSKPQDIKITNLNSRSVSISWTTETKTSGTVIYSQEDNFLPSILASLKRDMAYDDRDYQKAVSESAKELAENIDEYDSVVGADAFDVDISIVDTGKYYTHHVTIKDLQPETKYYFMVGDGVRYTNDSSLFYEGEFTVSPEATFTTFADLEDLEAPDPSYGRITDFEDGEVVTDSIMYLRPSSESLSVPLSAVVNEEGSWYIDISNIRNGDGSILTDIDESNAYHTVQAVGGNKGDSLVVLEPMSADAPMVDISVSNDWELDEEVDDQSSIFKLIFSAFSKDDDVISGGEASVIERRIGRCDWVSDGSCNALHEYYESNGKRKKIDCSNKRAECKAQEVTTRPAATGGGGGGSGCSMANDGKRDPGPGGVGFYCCGVSGLWAPATNPTTNTDYGDPKLACDAKGRNTSVDQVLFECIVNGEPLPSRVDKLSCDKRGGSVVTGARPTTGTSPEVKCKLANGKIVEIPVLECEKRGDIIKDDTVVAANTPVRCMVCNKATPASSNAQCVKLQSETKCESTTAGATSGSKCDNQGESKVVNGIKYVCTDKGALTAFPHWRPVIDDSDNFEDAVNGPSGGYATGNKIGKSCPKELSPCLCPNGNLMDEYGVCSNNVIASNKVISPGERCDASKGCWCDMGVLSYKELITRLSPVDLARSFPILGRHSGLVHVRISNGNSCPVIQSEASEEPTGNMSSIYAQSSISISPSNSMYAVEDSGIYCTTYKSEKYCFEVGSEGDQTLYIDANNNGTFDSGDVNIGDDAVKLSVSLEAKTSNMELTEGINFISFNFVNAQLGTTASEYLKNLNEVYGNAIYSIAKFESGKWVVVGNRDGESYGSDDFQIIPGKGYALKVKHDMLVNLSGKAIIEPVPVSLNAGWNLIAVHGGKKVYTAESLIDDINSVSGITANNVTKWDTSKGRYDGLQKESTVVYGFDYPISKLGAYFVRVDSGSGTWKPK